MPQRVTAKSVPGCSLAALVRDQVIGHGKQDEQAEHPWAAFETVHGAAGHEQQHAGNDQNTGGL